MTYPNEIEKTEGEIKVLQAKLELLKEMEKHKSPVEEAFYRAYGEITFARTMLECIGEKFEYPCMKEND